MLLLASTVLLAFLQTTVVVGEPHLRVADLDEDSVALNPVGCSLDDCPEYAGSVGFGVIESLLPPLSAIEGFQFMKHLLLRPYVSPVFSIATPNGETAQWFQLRTIRITMPDAEDPVLRHDMGGSRRREGQRSRQAAKIYRYMLVVFALSTAGHPYVHVGLPIETRLRRYGAVEGQAMLSLCSTIRLNLPTRVTGCVRPLTPNRLQPANDVRYNVIGGLDAAVAMAVQTAVDLERRAHPGLWSAPLRANSTCVTSLTDRLLSQSTILGTWTKDDNIVPLDTASYDAIHNTVQQVRQDRLTIARHLLAKEILALAKHPLEWSFPPTLESLGPLELSEREDEGVSPQQPGGKRTSVRRAPLSAEEREAQKYHKGVDEPDTYEDL